MSLERYEAMKRAVKPPVDLNVVHNPTIKSKKFGMIDIYVIEPNKEYSLFELYVISVNNPKLLIYNKKRGRFYANAYGQTYLSHGCPEFYKKFLIAMKKQDLGQEYLDACNKYLKEYARRCMESSDDE